MSTKFNVGDPVLAFVHQIWTRGVVVGVTPPAFLPLEPWYTVAWGSRLDQDGTPILREFLPEKYVRWPNEEKQFFKKPIETAIFYLEVALRCIDEGSDIFGETK